MMKQKDAVFAAISAGQEQGLEGKELRTFAVEQVKTGLMTGDVQHSKGPITDEKDALGYARGLVGNWLKKDERLTNGVKYVPQTKRGPIVKDETLRKLTASLKSLQVHNRPEDQALIARVTAAIETRKAEVAAAKASSKVQSMEETLSTLSDLGIDIEDVG